MKKLLSSFGVFVVASAATCTVNCKTTCKTVKKNLNILPESIQIHSETTVESFKDELIDALKTQPGFKNLTITKIKIEKGTTAGTDLQDSDITGSTIQVFLSVEIAGSKEFEGTKAVVVNWTVQTKKNLNSLTVPTAVVLPGANITEFKAALTNAIKVANFNNEFATITEDDYVLRNAENNANLTHVDIINAWICKVIRITIEVNPTSSKFIGRRICDINLYAEFNSLIEPTVVVSGSDIKTFKTALTNAIKAANSSNDFATLTDDDYVLKNVVDNADLTYDEIISAANKTGKIKVRITGRPGKEKFSGGKIIDIKVCDSFSDLKAPTIIVLPGADINEFKTALTNAIKAANSSSDFATLTDDDYVLRNAENTKDLTYDEIISAANKAGEIRIIIKAKSTSPKFVGSRIFNIKLRGYFKNLKPPTGVVLQHSNLNEFKTALTNAIKAANSNNVFAVITDDDYVLRNAENTTDLTDCDVVGWWGQKLISFVIEANPTSPKFKGKIDINNISLKMDRSHY